MQFNEDVLELIAQRFQAMSEPIRLKILQLLKDREMNVSEIAEEAGLKHGTASANLNALLKAGLVSCRREGTRSLYSISSPMVFQICELVCDSVRKELEEYVRLHRSIR